MIQQLNSVDQYCCLFHKKHQVTRRNSLILSQLRYGVRSTADLAESRLSVHYPVLFIIYVDLSTGTQADNIRAGLPAAGAGAEQAGCGWDVFIETWTQQQKLHSGSKARSLCWDDQLSELKSEPA